MGRYIAIKNTTLVIDPVLDFSDSGWSVSDNIGYHDGCSPGEINYIMDLTGFNSWTFEYELGPVFSGGININVGGVAGPYRTNEGVYKDTFNLSGANKPIFFFSDGKNSVKFLKTYPVLAQSNGKTLIFNEDVNLWGGEHSYRPEFMHQFINGLFMFKDGRLWEQDVNEIRNNFFGVQYTSKLKVVANIKDKSERLYNKLYFQLQIESNGKWSIPEMITPANETYPNGMKSKLHENNFTLDRGKYWADIMRDMLDPEFNNQLTALFEGRVMEGNMLILEMETKETKEIQLTGVRVYSAEQDRNI